MKPLLVVCALLTAVEGLLLCKNNEGWWGGGVIYVRNWRIPTYLQCFLHLLTGAACWPSVRTLAGMCPFTWVCARQEAKKHGSCGVLLVVRRPSRSFWLPSCPVSAGAACQCFPSLCLVLSSQSSKRHRYTFHSGEKHACRVIACL